MILAFWIVGAAVAAGLGLACFHLLGGRLPGWARLAGAGHGLLGTLGFGVVVAAVWAGAGARLAGACLAMALGAGAMIAVAHWRGRQASGLVVALHAVLGMGGFLLLLGTQ